MINEKNIFYFPYKEKPIIGYCPQFDSVFEYLSVQENLRFYGKLKGIDEYSLNFIVEIIMEKLDLKKFDKKLSVHLSGGNKRKLSVGISILSKPCVILMDEPSTGMDPYTRRLLLNLLNRAYLKNYNYKGKKKENKEEKSRSIVLTTHSTEEAETLCDKIGVLSDGKLKKEGKISELISSSNIELDIEFKKHTAEYLKEKYGDILNQKIESEEKLKIFLFGIKKKLAEFLKNNHFGKDLLKVIKNKKSINIYTVLRWAEYMVNMMNLIEKIKESFDYVHCTKFKLNSFVFTIRNIGIKNNSEKNDNRIFGIIEKYKDKFEIEEYTYLLTTLEDVFINCYKKEDKEQDKKDNKNIDISL
jgi:ABC-type multidrug transport system ATPase subunit